MLVEIARKPLAITLVILGGFLCVGDLAAQAPGMPKPTPLPTPTTRVIPAQPPAKEPVTEPPRFDRRTLPPDLQLTLSPMSMTSAPMEFTVRNAGLGGATEASLLRVAVRVLPLRSWGPLWFPLGLGFVGGGTPEQIEEELREIEEEFLGRRCPLPYHDFQEAIGPLDPDDSQLVSKSPSREGGIVAQARMPAGSVYSPRHSFINNVEIRLTCVYEVRATADANGDLRESNEANNEVVSYYKREVTLR